ELAISLDILPWQAGTVAGAVKVIFEGWHEDRGGDDPAEVRTAIEQIRGLLERHGDGRFDPAAPDPNTATSRARRTRHAASSRWSRGRRLFRLRVSGLSSVPHLPSLPVGITHTHEMYTASAACALNGSPFQQRFSKKVGPPDFQKIDKAPPLLYIRP